jgi:hypothetical protein
MRCAFPTATRPRTAGSEMHRIIVQRFQPHSGTTMEQCE